MNLWGDGGVALIGIVVAVIAVIVAWRKPDKIRAQYESKLAHLEDEIEALRLEYRRMAADYLRIIGENHWLRLQLRRFDIDIPPLPSDLQPKVDAQGNISIVVSPSGGVQVTGGHMESKRDVVGGDVGESTRKKQEDK